jgi:hypothetical protein
MKADISQFRRACHESKLTEDERRQFSVYYHQRKRLGYQGSKKNGDPSWHELLELIREWKQGLEQR